MAPPVQTAVRPPDPGDPRSNDVSNPRSPNYDPNDSAYDATRDPSSRYYIDRSGQVDTGEEVRDQAEQDVTAHDERTDGGFLGLQDLIEMFTRNGRIDDRTNQELSAQAAQLAAGLPTRPAPPIDSANYMYYDHGQLKTMVTENANPGDVGTTGDLWIDAGNEMIRFQDRVAGAINNSEADWQGSAANQARGFMAGVGNWVGTAGQSAALAGTQTNVQSEALSTATSSMPEEVPWDRDAWIQRIQTSSDPMGTYMDALDEYDRHQEAHEQAAQVVTTYDGGLSGASTMPAFTAPPTMAGEGGSSDTSTGDSDGVGRIGGEFNGPDGTSSDGGSRSGDPSGSPYTPPSSPGGPSGPSGPGGPSTPPGGRPPDGTDPSQVPGLPGGPGGPNPPGGQPPSGQGGVPPMFPGPIGGGGLPGGDSQRPGGGGRPGSGGFGPGGGRGFGPGGGSGGGFGSGSGSGSGSGAGSGSGSGAGGGRGGGGLGQGGAGALAAEEAARGGRGGVGAGGGRGGAGGMPMGMGGARGQGDEDGEHQRPSYLVEADPDSLFGTDELTAPPVIGE